MMAAMRLGRYSGWLMCAAAVALGVVLLLPAIINGFPLLFPDSVGYFSAGDAALGKVTNPFAPAVASDTNHVTLAVRAEDSISTSRSVYYGIFFNLLYRLGGAWALPIVQTIVVVISLGLALRRIGGGPRLAVLLAGAAILAGVGVYAGAVMPDVFAGLMILGLALLGVQPGLSRGERAWWIGMVLAACLFHKAHLAVGLAMLAVIALVLIVRGGGLRRLILPAVALALAWGGHAAVGLTIERLTGKPPLEVSFLLARMIGDGTAERYLRANCGSRSYVLCRHLHRFPLTNDGFLWSPNQDTGLLKLVDLAERQAIAREANSIVVGTALQFPVEQLRISAGNFIAQLGDVGATEFERRLLGNPAATPRLRPLLDAYKDSAVVRGQLHLDAISWVMRATYLLAFIALVVAAWRLLRTAAAAPPTDDPRPALAGLLVVGLVLNAGVCGALVGVYDRYQGRVAWLMPLAALYLWSVLRDRRSQRSELAAGPAASAV